MSTRWVTASLIAAGLCGACGTDVSPDLVVRDAAPGGGIPTLLGADPSAVFWSISKGNGPKEVAGSSLDALPTNGQSFGMTSGPIAHAGDHIVFANGAVVLRASIAVPSAKAAAVTAEALAESLDSTPVLVWTEGAVVSWGTGDVSGTATLPKIVRCDHILVTAKSIYVAADATSERRLLRIDRKTRMVVPLTSSSMYGELFPGGGASGASYRGRLVGADDDGASWLVEETVPGATAPARAILVSVPEQGESSVVLEHINAPSGFFTTPDAFYWQERDALLTAPRAGGEASIIGHLSGTAGAIDSGFVYYVTGTAIERLYFDALD